MQPSTFIDIVIIIGSAILGFAPLSRRRVRAPWANLAFIFVALLGVLIGSLSLSLNLKWISPGPGVRWRLDQYVSVSSGVVFGLLCALTLSRQLRGIKKET